MSGPPASEDDDQAVRRVLQGDSDAFAALVGRYQKPIFNLMRRAVGSPQEAADLTQEAFFQAYRKLARFTAGRKFFPWIYTLSLNVLRDHMRQRPRPSLSLEDMGASGSGSSLSSGGNPPTDEIALRQAMARLPVEMREALWLHYREQWSFKEIAGALGLSLSAVKMRIHRGVERMRVLLMEKSDGQDRSSS